ncbi:MAG TPA: AAA family ATPase [Elusimicrobiales bacterium]|nr:AAA family ATPase [Elusimicrobiales bacterium]
MFWLKLKMFLGKHWLVLSIIAVVIVAVIFPIWYLAGVEENTRRYIISMNVASMPWMVLNTVIFVGFLYLMQAGGMSALKKTKVDAGLVNVKFSDVMGLGEAKREAWEVVQLIKDRARVKAIGGKILKGVLLVGPPGCGKTMLAKAVASEAGVPFISISGSEFVEVFVGVGASRVRKLFKQAREYAQAHGSCIIFIDEIEVIGRKRLLHDAFGGGSETNSTQNQLLVEMDGLDSDVNIVVFAATNALEEILDDALLRPGRFDRKIFVGKPNLEERAAIFSHYLGKIKFDPVLEVGRLARKAVNKTPAEVENIIKEAALIAARSSRDMVTYEDISSAIERIELGVAHRLTMTPREREMTAFHEAGHLTSLYLTHPTKDVFKASIISRGDAMGVVHSVPVAELHAPDRNSLLADIDLNMGGYAAEKIKYGVTSTGVASDFRSAANIAHAMVWRFGMGTGGVIGDISSLPASERSNELCDRLNRETQELLAERLRATEALLRENWPIVERFAAELLAREELDFDEIAAIFSEYGKPPRLIPKT